MPRFSRLNLSDRLARWMGLATAADQDRLFADLARARQDLRTTQNALVASISELQQWNSNQAREIGELSTLLRHPETDRALLLAIGELTARHREVRDVGSANAYPHALDSFELRAFSQNGEDGVIAEILRRVGAPDRCFVEFGVQRGEEGNCVFLADHAGYSGLFIEADPDDFRALRGKYSERSWIRTFCERVTSDNVESIFAAADIPLEPAVLSIDVDGADYWIWEAVSRYHPRLVVIEYNSTLPSVRRLVQPRDLGSGWDGTDYYGASLGALSTLGQTKGYQLVHVGQAALNAFFVRSDLAAGRFPEPGDVVLRAGPNYFHVGYRHPTDERARRYLDLDTGKLADVANESR